MRGGAWARTGLGVLLAFGCANRLQRTTTPEPETVLRLPSPDGNGDEVSGIAFWQGWAMYWGYNHRMNRTGSLLEQLPCRAVEDSIRQACRARIIATAASGTGTDVARLESYYAVSAIRGAVAASGAREFVVQGLEGDDLSLTLDVSIPVDDALAEMPRHVAFLSGFDAASFASADKLQRFGIRVGEPSIEAEVAKVPVTVEGRFDCTTAECPSENRVDYSILVGVTLLGATPGALGVEAFSLPHQYDWSKDTELSQDQFFRAVEESRPVDGESLMVIRGFEVETDKEMHLLELGINVSPAVSTERPEAALGVRNWKKGMKGARPPMSWFSFRQAGEASWMADLLRLDFRHATVERLVWETDLEWAGKGKPSLGSEGERVRMLYWEIEP